jgi:hypothetical protein
MGEWQGYLFSDRMHVPCFFCSDPQHHDVLRDLCLAGLYVQGVDYQHSKRLSRTILRRCGACASLHSQDTWVNRRFTTRQNPSLPYLAPLIIRPHGWGQLCSVASQPLPDHAPLPPKNYQMMHPALAVTH